MLRHIGSAMIGSVCALYGFRMAESLKRRRDFLSALLSSLSALETEISFGRYELAVIFKRLEARAGLYGLYGICAKAVTEVGIKTAWQKAVNSISERACIKKADKEVIETLGNELGMSDVDGQKKALRRVCALLEDNLSNADDEYKRLSKMYRGCGILAGVFIVIAVM